MEKISAVLCTYDRYSYLPAAIDSLVEQDLPNNTYEIIVVDNTPPDRREKGVQLKARYSNIENVNYVFEDVPGLSNARNVGARLSKSEIISYIDDDAVACKSWLAEILKGFQAFKNVGVLGGRIAPVWEAPRPSWLGDELLGNVSVVDWGGELRIADKGEWFAGANISFKKSALLECGGFSTHLGRNGNTATLLSNEESELLERLKSKKYAHVYNPNASVDHLVPESRLCHEWFRRRVAWQAASDMIMGATNVQDDGEALRRNINAYLSQLPPVQRNIQGLYHPEADSGQFNWQLSAIYGMTILCLSGFRGLDSDQ